MKGGEGYENWSFHGYDWVQWSEKWCMEIMVHHCEIKEGFWDQANVLSFYCFNLRYHPRGWNPQAFGWIAQECHVENVTFGGCESKAFRKINWYEIQHGIPKINNTINAWLCNTWWMWISSFGSWSRSFGK
jgi:hypothetical protein